MKNYRKTLLALFCLTPFAVWAQLPYLDGSLPIETRVNDLVSRMTLEEKVSQMMHTSKGIERLKVPPCNWWNECLHGVARSSEKTTVFPQPIGLGATFNPQAIKRMAEMIAAEGRVVHQIAVEKGTTLNRYTGLTFWTPNINIFRDPRWGRGHETYGEDPVLTAEMGIAMVRGLQGEDSVYLNVAACAKHFAVHSGPEALRHEFDAKASDHDLFDTYLPAFYRLVTEANVAGVMCAYNRFNGQPCCGSNLFLRKILLTDWDFKGYVTSDCWAINDFWGGHKTHATSAEAVADAVLHGTDLECGESYTNLLEAVQKGLITEAQLDISLKRLLTVRYRLGLFDTQHKNPYANRPKSLLEAPEHGAHALDLARQSMVLLSNKKKLLPLSSKKKYKILLVGPNADNQTTQLGNYNGFPTHNVTLLEALRNEPNVEVVYDPLTDFTTWKDGTDIDSLMQQCQDADMILFAGGISPLLEGEQGDAGGNGVEGFRDGDRTTIALPKVQTQAMQQLQKMHKPIVFVCMSGSAVSYNWEAEHLSAVIQAWYGGQAAGTALTDILFGRYNPSGRLPLTFYRSDADLPPFEDYSMQGRTYRYFEGDVLYPFGYGLSYTTFKYRNLKVPSEAQTGDSLRVSVEVVNTGKMAGEEVVQLYLSHREMAEEAPLCALKKFMKIKLKPNERRTVSFVLSPRELAFVDLAGEIRQDAGTLKVFVGGVCPSAPQRFTQGILSASLQIQGESKSFLY